MVEHIGLTPLRTTTSPGRAFKTLAAIVGGAIGTSFEAEARDIVDTYQYEEVAYFLIGEPFELRRFNLTTERWLPAIDLQPSGELAAFTVHEDGIYVAVSDELRRYPRVRSGLPTTILPSIPYTETVLITEEHILLHGWDRITTYDRSDLQQIDQRAQWHTLHPGVVFSERHRMILGRTRTVSPDDIVRWPINLDGTIQPGGDSRYHSDYPRATRCFLSPGQDFVVDDSGTIYDLPFLRYTNSFPGRFDGIAFFGADIPIIVSGQQLIAYSNAVVETGRKTLDFAAGSVFVAGEAALAFANSVVADAPLAYQRVPLRNLNVVAPGSPLDASALQYDPGEVFVDDDGIVYLMSEKDRSFFRWSPEDHRYLSPVSLRQLPLAAAYSEAHDAVFVHYESGVLSRVELGASSPYGGERLIANDVNGTVNGLTAVGDNLAVAAGRIGTRTAEGAVIDFHVNGPESSNYPWNPRKRRLYYIDYQSLYWLEVLADGSFGGSKLRRVGQARGPVLLSPDGNGVLANNRFYESENFAETGSLLGNVILDGVWLSDQIVTIREIGGVTQLQQWTGASFSLSRTTQFDGVPRRIIQTPRGLLLITLVNGRPKFHLLHSSSGTVLFESPSLPAAPTDLHITSVTDSSVQLNWQGPGQVDFEMQGRGDGSLYWETIVTIASGTTSTAIEGLNPGSGYQFRIRSRNHSGPSAFTEAIEAFTLSDSNAPAGRPYRLRTAQLFADSVTIEWDDNADNEDGFRIIRASGTSEQPVEVGTVGANVRQFSDTTVQPDTEYEYWVQAFNSLADGDISDPLSLRTADSPTAPIGAPSNPEVVAITSTSVELVWQDNSLNEDGFDIQRRTGNLPFVNVGRVAWNVTGFIDLRVRPDTDYDYRIQAFNQSGTSTSPTIAASTPPVGGHFSGQAMASNGIFYFLMSSPDRIERFDMRSGLWLGRIPLALSPRALWIDDSAIFLGAGNDVLRLDETGNTTPVTTASFEIESVFRVGDTLVAHWRDQFRSYNLSTASVLQTFDSGFPLRGFFVHESSRRVFARTQSTSPADIYYLDFNANGSIGRIDDSPAHGDYPDAERTFASPDGSFALDDSGTVYRGDSLAFARSIAGDITDVAFDQQGRLVVLRDNRVSGYTTGFVVDSEQLLGAFALRISIEGETVWVFTPTPSEPRGFRASSFQRSSLGRGAPPSAGQLSLTVPADGPSFIDLAKVLRHVSDPDGDQTDVPRLQSVSAEGGSATIEGGMLVYTPPPNYQGSDLVRLTISDGVSTVEADLLIHVGEAADSSTGNQAYVVALPDGTVRIAFHGIPGFTYGVERSVDATDWVQIAAITAGSKGRLVTEDTDPPGPTAIYRLVYPAH